MSTNEEKIQTEARLKHAIEIFLSCRNDTGILSNKDIEDIGEMLKNFTHNFGHQYTLLRKKQRTWTGVSALMEKRLEEAYQAVKIDK